VEAKSSSRRRTFKRAVPYLALVMLAVLVGWRVFRHVIPAGASFFPYTLASVEKGVYEPPSMQTSVTIVYNDAGAAHSGNHWTWLITDHWLTGKRVVFDGYTKASIIDEPLEISWLDDHTLQMPFAKGRYGDSSELKTISVGR